MEFSVPVRQTGFSATWFGFSRPRRVLFSRQRASPGGDLPILRAGAPFRPFVSVRQPRLPAYSPGTRRKELPGILLIVSDVVYQSSSSRILTLVNTAVLGGSRNGQRRFRRSIMSRPFLPQEHCISYSGHQISRPALAGAQVSLPRSVDRSFQFVDIRKVRENQVKGIVRVDDLQWYAEIPLQDERGSKGRVGRSDNEMFFRLPLSRTIVLSSGSTYSASMTAPPGSLNRTSRNPLFDRKTLSISAVSNCRSSVFSSKRLVIVF